MTCQFIFTHFYAILVFFLPPDIIELQMKKWFPAVNVNLVVSEGTRKKNQINVIVSFLLRLSVCLEWQNLCWPQDVKYGSICCVIANQNDANVSNEKKFEISNNFHPFLADLIMRNLLLSMKISAGKYILWFFGTLCRKIYLFRTKSPLLRFTHFGKLKCFRCF